MTPDHTQYLRALEFRPAADELAVGMLEQHEEGAPTLGQAYHASGQRDLGYLHTRVEALGYSVSRSCLEHDLTWLRDHEGV